MTKKELELAFAQLELRLSERTSYLRRDLSAKKMNSDHFWIQLELARRQREAGDLIASANTLLAAYDVLLSHYDEAIEHCERLLKELHQAKLETHREHRT
jgi:hypothetical protein